MLLSLALLCWMICSDSSIIERFKNKKWISYPIFFLTIVLFSIGIRLFFFEIFSIPSGSMEDTIIPGDKIIMSKLSYGPRLPSSPFEIPWVNIGFLINKNMRAKADSVWWNYKRLNGFSEIKPNDVVVINSTGNSNEILIKRCMGIPGDTLLIKNEQVYSNGKEIPERGTIRLLSRIVFRNVALASSLLDSLDLKDNYFITGSEDNLTVSLNRNQVNALKKYKCIDSIFIEKERPDTAYNKFPHDTLFHWTIDDYGPVIIPSKGMTIQLNRYNYILYRRAINRFEGVKINEISDAYYIDGIKAADYTFKINYYFMLGDNRHDSKDSRYIGFIPEQNIIGKAVLILFSNGEEEFHWNRIFKIIH